MLGGFNGLDVAIVALLIIGMGVGYAQGLLRGVMGLAALYIAAILASQYYTLVAGWLRFLLSQTPSKFVNALAFFIILAATAALINYLAAEAYSSTRLRLHPLVDQLGGSVLGLTAMFITITLALPVIQFATSEVWPWGDNFRFLLIDGLKNARLVDVFKAIKPILLKALEPWVPAGLLSIFNL